jgi:hypothetical protein
MGPSVVKALGDRAIADTDCAVLAIRKMGGAEIAVISYTRVLSRALRTDEGCLLAGGNVIYIRDMMLRRNPNYLPNLDDPTLVGFRDSYRYLGYVLPQAGHPAKTDLPGFDRPETVVAARAVETRWLQGELGNEGPRAPGAVR